MNNDGYIYRDADPPKEDVARLQGYLIARAEADKGKRPCGELRFVQLAADQHGLAGLDQNGRVWQHIPGNGWTAVEMNVMEERRGP